MIGTSRSSLIFQDIMNFVEFQKLYFLMQTIIIKLVQAKCVDQPSKIRKVTILLRAKCVRQRSNLGRPLIEAPRTI